jgi:hypothetical protein
VASQDPCSGARPRRGGAAVAPAHGPSVRSISARAALYARSRRKMAREACARALDSQARSGLRQSQIEANAFDKVQRRVRIRLTELQQVATESLAGEPRTMSSVAVQSSSCRT